MKTLLTILCVVAVASVTWAEKPVQTIDNPDSRIECSLETITFDWDFGVSDWGFTTETCDDGGAPVWEYGVSPPWAQNIWMTILDGNYPNDAGESLISPSFIVDGSTYLVEIRHIFWVETSYDGGNLSVNGVVVPPLVGYPDDEVSDSPSFYAWCVDGEPGFNGISGVWTSCFDLSDFVGEEVQLSFDFGSDSSVNLAGWSIAYVKVGGAVVANEGVAWSDIKGLYR